MLAYPLAGRSHLNRHPDLKSNLLIEIPALPGDTSIISINSESKYTSFEKKVAKYFLTFSSKGVFQVFCQNKNKYPFTGFGADIRVKRKHL